MNKTIILSILALATLLLIVPIGSALYPSITPWSVYRHDASHSGATSSDAPSTNNTLYAIGHSAGGIVTTSPLVVDGRVIFAMGRFAVAKDETTGVELWRYEAPGKLTTPSYADGRIFFGMSEGIGGIICINASTGGQIWIQDASPYFVNSSPLVHNGIVYAGLTDNNTRAFNATTGHHGWGYKTDGPVYASPAADGDLLFFGSDDSKLYALDISGVTPVSLWNFTTNGAIECTPTIAADKILFGSDNRTLYALNKITGELIWTWTTTAASRIRNGVAVANNIVYVTPEATTGMTADMGKIYALRNDVSPGNYTETDFDIRYWQKQYEGFLIHEPVYANGKIVVTAQSGNGVLMALDADVGTTLWERISGWWPAVGDPVVADGHVWYTVYWWDPGSFTLYCVGGLFPPSTTIFNVNVGGSDFAVALETNSTVMNLNTTALETEGKISFNAQGIGATDVSNITIPNAMLSGPFNVTANGEQPFYLAPATNNGTHTSLYFTYNGTTPQTIEIVGTTVIPEFPIAALGPMLITALLAAIAPLTRKHRK